MKSYQTEPPLKSLSRAIGAGILAGLAGTAAITLSQLIEKRLTNRASSKVPIKAVSKVLDLKPTQGSNKEKVAQEIHWTYGTIWGVPRGLITLTGLKGLSATAIHFAAITGTALTVLPKLELAPPVTEEDPKTLAIDALHHAVYALAAGLAYDAITGDE